ncbi:MAG: hypothetical protein D6755_00330 [Anaerolineae bacterium]|nr:MAG: hypothetical protein D6755_00330 [Anaerolineae bacterium]
MSLDEFRTDDFFSDEEDDAQDGFPLEAVIPEAEAPRLERTRRSGNFLGMTPPQRAVLAVLLFMEVCALSLFILVATGRVVPPGMY